MTPSGSYTLAEYWYLFQTRKNLKFNAFALKFSHQMGSWVLLLIIQHLKWKRLTRIFKLQNYKIDQARRLNHFSISIRILSDPCYDIIFHVSGQMLSNSWIPSLIWNKMLRARARWMKQIPSYCYCSVA